MAEEKFVSYTQPFNLPSYGSKILPPVDTEIAYQANNQAINSMTNGIKAFVDLKKEQWDHNAKKSGMENARMAVDAGVFQVKDEVTVANKAYNAMGLDLTHNNVMLEASNRLREIFDENRANPQGFIKSAEELKHTLGSSLPVEISSQFENTYNSMMVHYTGQSRSNQENLLVQEHKATFDRTMDDFTKNIMEVARAGNVEATANLITNFEGVLNRNGPIALGGSGVLSPSQQSDFMVAMNKLAEKEIVVGAFDRVPDLVGKMRYIQNYEVFNEDSIFNAEEKEKVLNELYNRFATQSRSQKLVEKQNEDQAEATADGAYIGFIQNFENDEAFNLALSSASAVGDTARVEKILKIRREGFLTDTTDVGLMRGIERRFLIDRNPPLPVELQNYLESGILSRSDFDRYLKMREDYQSERYEFIRNPMFKQEEDRIKRHFGFTPDLMGIQILDSAKKQQQYENLVQALDSYQEIVREEWQRYIDEGRIGKSPNYVYYANGVIKSFKSNENKPSSVIVEEKNLNVR